ncbi:Ig-like domain-containing protein [uncultured Paraglaciecola sp.]|uniref:Ig-like domain-containing protein n=1 Tax=uncultured Paraglaciecola sp. TaxID=1765024 RepID=UPI0025CC7696|nr:Ig-like domain-containing protein [uncultured Paraglaciecola sp.]
MSGLKDTHLFHSLLSYFFVALLLSGCGGGDDGGSTPIPTTPTTPTLSSLSITPVESTLKKSETFQLSVTGTYSNNSTQNLTSSATWTVADAAVLEVSNTGLITTLEAGTTTVTATYEGKSNEISVSVKALTDLVISPVVMTLLIGSSEQLNVTGQYTDNSNENLDSLVTWESSDPSVASISTSGVLLAVSAGSTSITASLQGVSKTFQVTVKALTDLVISPIVMTLVIGSSEQLNVTGQYTDNSNENLNSSVTWESSDPSVASISTSGVLLAISEGTTSITASFQGISETLPIRVLQDFVSLSVTEVTSPLKIAETFQLIATSTLANGSSQDSTSLASWSVADSEVLNVSDTGLVTALSAGTTSVTATFEGLSTQQNISVKALTALAISPTTVTLAIASSQQLSLSGIYSDNSNETLTNGITWQSSNPSIASISNTGVVLGISVGTVSITAGVGELSSNLNVTISPATLQSIVVSSPIIQIAAGLTSNFSAKGIYSDGTEQDLSNQVVWSVSDSTIASINSETGLLTALQTGSVSAIASKQGLTSSLSISVSAATLTGIAITPSELSLAKGTIEPITVTATFSDNTKLDVGSQVEWTNSNNEIASIESDPSTVSALMPGSTTLTASLSGQQAELSIDVTDAELVSLTLSPINTSIPLGQSQQYSAQGTFSDGTVQDLTSEVTWLSSNQDKALISNTQSSPGLADSVALGSTSLTAVLGSIQQNTMLTISNAVLSSIEIQPTNQTVAKGTDTQIKALGHFTDGSLIDLTSQVLWSSSNTSSVDVQSSSNGSVLIQNEGSALISAELQGLVGLGHITVTSATLQSIFINAAQTSVPSGITQRLIAVGTYSDMTSRDVSQQVSWKSDDVLKATVANNNTESGLVTAISPGQLTISANLDLLTDQINIDVTDAELTSIQVNSASTQVIVPSSILATAIANFSDSSTLDVSSQVNWLSSDTNIAEVGNSSADKGLVKALAAGSVNISASILGINSLLVPLEVSLEPNLPKALSLTVQPNFILNDDNDTALVNLVLVPNAETGVIADGTPITLTINEGTTNRDEELVTTNGAVSYLLKSTYDGFISLSATASNYSVGAGVSSTDELTDAFSVIGQGSAVYENNTLKAGSVFYLFVKNLTNRAFIVEQINFGYLDPNNNNAFVNFPESPISSGAFVSNGDLTAGEFNYIGYELESDVEASIYVISYLLYDSQSDSTFRFDSTFNFAQ